MDNTCRKPIKACICKEVAPGPRRLPAVITPLKRKDSPMGLSAAKQTRVNVQWRLLMQLILGQSEANPSDLHGTRSNSRVSRLLILNKSPIVHLAVATVRKSLSSDTSAYRYYADTSRRPLWPWVNAAGDYLGKTENEIRL